jgi:hypothetical protein
MAEDTVPYKPFAQILDRVHWFGVPPLLSG